MEIWRDTISSSDRSFTRVGDYNGECEGPSDCECPDPYGDRRISSTVDGHLSNMSAPYDWERHKTDVLQQSSPLFMKTVSQEYTLVCAPTGSGQIAVLDREAIDLLERFRMPIPLAEVMREEKNVQRIEAPIALFYNLGFLQHTGQPLAVQTQQGEEVLSAWLHITNSCNLRCTYCYLEKTSEHMADETAYRAVDAIFRSAVKHGYKYVRLRYAGGEASLRLARVLAVHEYASSLARRHGLGLFALLLSNGVALGRRTLEQLRKHHIDVCISMDGIDAYHDSQRPFKSGQSSFLYVDRTIKQMLASHFIPRISVTVSRRNLPGLPALMEYLLEHDLPFSLNYYRDNECSTHRSDLQFEEEQMIAGMRATFAIIERRLPRRRMLGSLIDKGGLQYLHNYTCGVARNYLVIDQHGGVAKCHADIKRTVGTIEMDDPLEAVRRDRLGVQAYAAQEKEGCRTCDWRYWCTGGCPVLTHRLTGRYDVKSPNCAIYKALFPEVLRLEALRLLKYGEPISF